MKEIIHRIIIIALFFMFIAGIYIMFSAYYFGNIPDAIYYLAKTLQGMTFTVIGAIGLLMEVKRFLANKQTND